MKCAWVRPATHAGMLAFVLLAPLLGKWGMAGVAFAAFLANLLILPRTAFGKSLAREGEPRWNGLVAYPLAVALGYALFEPEVAALAWTVMATGDPAATLAGNSRPWKARIPWNRSKSAAGSAAFTLAAAAGTFAVFYAYLGSERIVVGPALVGSASIAALGALLESIPWPRDDNLPVLLGVGGTLTILAAML